MDPWAPVIVSSEPKVDIETWKDLPLSAQLMLLPCRRINTPNGGIDYKSVMPRLHLVSGDSLSVQASEHTYCIPRDNEGPYTHVEVGFVKGHVPDAWKEYAEDTENLNETVFAYIPMHLVMLYIGANGGIDKEASFGMLKSWELLLK